MSRHRFDNDNDPRDFGVGDDGESMHEAADHAHDLQSSDPRRLSPTLHDTEYILGKLETKRVQVFILSPSQCKEVQIQ